MKLGQNDREADWRDIQNHKRRPCWCCGIRDWSVLNDDCANVDWATNQVLLFCVVLLFLFYSCFGFFPVHLLSRSLPWCLDIPLVISREVITACTLWYSGSSRTLRVPWLFLRLGVSTLKSRVLWFPSYIYQFLCCLLDWSCFRAYQNEASHYWNFLHPN